MKPAGLPLLVVILAGPGSAQVPSATLTNDGTVKTSERLAQEIRTALPKFTPPPAPVLDQPKDLENDSDVLLLPKFTVNEKRPPSHDPDLWLTKKSVQQKAMAAYKQSLTDLEWTLNGWYIPIFGSSPSARARSSYENQKKMSELQRVHRLFSVISSTDSRAATELEKERVKMEQTEYWQSRPAGDGRAK